MADEILAVCSQNRQSAKINSLPKFLAIRYSNFIFSSVQVCMKFVKLNCEVYSFVCMKMQSKGQHFVQGKNGAPIKVVYFQTFNEQAFRVSSHFHVSSNPCIQVPHDYQLVLSVYFPHCCLQLLIEALLHFLLAILSRSIHLYH